MPTMNRLTNNEVYERVTAQIIEQLKRGVVPWSKPWTDGNPGGAPALFTPRNAATKRGYSGVNVLVLWSVAMERGYSSTGWVTFKQAIKHGAVVRKGEKGTAVIYMDKKTKRTTNAAGEEETQRFFLARMFTVFNVEQLADLADHPGAVEKLRARIAGRPTTTETEDGGEPFAPLDECDAILTRHTPKLKHGGDRAYYSPLADFVQMPPKKAFKSREAYFGTLFHELVHWTGHRDRLGRSLLNGFGSVEYALEELVAELGAAMLAARTGVPQIDQSAAYLQCWLDVLQKKAQPGELTGAAALVKCASLASAAAEYLAPSAAFAADDDDETESEAA